MDLIIQRPKQYADFFRNYTIYIDGEKRGTLAAGEQLILRNLPNTLALAAKIDWCKTAEHRIHAQEETTHRVQVKNNIHPLTFILLGLSMGLLACAHLWQNSFPALELMSVTISGVALAWLLYQLTIGRKQYLKITSH